jgi:hypothetical protein
LLLVKVLVPMRCFQDKRGHLSSMSKKSETENWPDFFIVGAAKSGTTSVWEYLRSHPHVFFPTVKEPHYFVSIPARPGDEWTYFAGNREGYLNLYKDARGYKASGDASPGYLWDVNSARMIHEVSPNAKIVILLRDPIERAQSHYLRMSWWGIDPLSFPEAIRRDNSRNSDGWWNKFLYVEAGLYYEQVRRYLEAFGKEQVGVYLFEDLEKDTPGVVSAIARHIGVDPALLDQDELRRVHNLSRAPRFKWLYDGVRGAFSLRLRMKILPEPMRKWMSYNPIFYKSDKPRVEPEARRYLQDIYEPDLRNLERLLGKKLPELRKSWV